MSKMKSLAMLQIASIMLGGEFMGDSKNSITPSKISGEPKEKPIPKGCIRLYFDSEGRECKKGEHTIFFDGMNKANVYKKANKWKDLLNIKKME